ncbi:uncharacterized protein [Apostichopus japonicus]|uniref:uncharacterized protein isoform X4 n=1 Tax=Stichopus japonicus TaxID=307972 RepID=UPI003AB2DB6B
MRKYSERGNSVTSLGGKTWKHPPVSLRWLFTIFVFLQCVNNSQGTSTITASTTIPSTGSTMGGSPELSGTSTITASTTIPSTGSTMGGSPELSETSTLGSTTESPSVSATNKTDTPIMGTERMTSLTIIDVTTVNTSATDMMTSTLNYIDVSTDAPDAEESTSEITVALYASVGMAMVLFVIVVCFIYIRCTQMKSKAAVDEIELQTGQRNRDRQSTFLPASKNETECSPNHEIIFTSVNESSSPWPNEEDKQVKLKSFKSYDRDPDLLIGKTN